MQSTSTCSSVQYSMRCNYVPFGYVHSQQLYLSQLACALLSKLYSSLQKRRASLYGCWKITGL